MSNGTTIGITQCPTDVCSLYAAILSTEFMSIGSAKCATLSATDCVANITTDIATECTAYFASVSTAE